MNSAERDAVAALVSTATALLKRLELEREEEGRAAVFLGAAMIDPLRRDLDGVRSLPGYYDVQGTCDGCDQQEPVSVYENTLADGSTAFVRYCVACAEGANSPESPQIRSSKAVTP